MDSGDNPTPAASSLSYQPPRAHPNTYPILEISLISAQDLALVSKSLRTYALTWIHPNRKRTTRIDNEGNSNPKWNDKFSFRITDEFLNSDDSAVHVEIYTVSWFRDVLVGTVQVLLHNLINPLSKTSNSGNKRFVALQIRRPSGNPQGILNMGVAILDSSMRSMPLCSEIDPSCLDYRDMIDKKLNNNNNENDETIKLTNKVQLWRSLSVDDSEDNTEEFPNKSGSICNGSMLNGSVCNGSMINGGSELCSDIGPSASIVAAEIAKMSQLLPPSPRPEVPQAMHREQSEFDDRGSSILEELTAEEAYAKGLTSSMERWRKAAAERHSRRNSDGGLFSCFGTAYGFEFKIVCGASNNNKINNGNRRDTSKKTKKCSSETSSE